MFSTPILEDMNPTQVRKFSDFAEWFFNTLETINFTSGAYAPCDQWWEHPEALHRLVGLWASFAAVALPEITDEGEILNDDSLKVADSVLSWWREVDHHKTILFEGKTSPFSSCASGKHHDIHTAVTSRWEGALLASLPARGEG